MKEKISILGCGWLGKPLAFSLINKGFEVSGSTTSTHKLVELKSNGIVPFLIDINSENNYSQFLNADILIIAITSKNSEAFKNLIEQIEKSQLTKVLFVSSTSVYENSNNIITEETSTKDCPLKTIEYLFTKNNNFKTTIIRFGGLFGYNRIPANFIPSNKKIKNPEGFINFIHRDDCIQIIEEIIFQNCWNTVLNACSDSHPKRRDFYTNENSKLGRKTPLFDENSINEYKIISSEKLKKVLNYNFKYSDLMNYL